MKLLAAMGCEFKVAAPVITGGSAHNELPTPGFPGSRLWASLLLEKITVG